MATRRAGTSSSTASTKWMHAFTGRSSPARGKASGCAELSLDGDLACAAWGAVATSARRRARPTAGPPSGWCGDPVLVDEHEGGDQLALRVQEGHLRGGGDHVGQKRGPARAKLADQLDHALAVAAHAFVSGRRENRTRSSPSLMVAPAVSRLASTLGSEISRR